MFSRRHVPGLIFAAAFFAVYFFWGSSYVAIALAIKTVPPLIMSAVRYLLAGTVLYLVCRATGTARPNWREWGKCSILGFLLIFGGNAGSTWAVKHIPSGLAALLVATEPLWLVLLAWMMGCESRPKGRVIAGLLIGFAGMAILIGSPGAIGFTQLGVIAMAITVLGAVIWAFGSVLAIRIPTQSSPFMSSAMMLLSGGMMFAVVGALSGEARGFALAGVSWTAVGSIVYLAICCSILPLSAYLWLLRKTCPHRVATHAFVNPIVAVFLGWLIVGETITLQTVVAGVAVVVGVVLLVLKPVSESVITVTAIDEEDLPAPEPVLQTSNAS